MVASPTAKFVPSEPCGPVCARHGDDAALLTAGDGYLYLVRQVAAADSTERGQFHAGRLLLGQGESPGRWMGRGLAALSDTGRCEVSPQAREEIWTVDEGSEVGEAQMRASTDWAYIPTPSASRPIPSAAAWARLGG